MKSFFSKFAEKRGVSCLLLLNQIPARQLACGKDASLLICYYHTRSDLKNGDEI